MTAYPWLPEPLKFCDYDIDQERITEVAYAIFKNDFIDSCPTCSGFSVKSVRGKMEGGKEETFWHIIKEEDKHQKGRIFKTDRCERINWPRPIIEGLSEGRVICWKKLHHEKGKKEWRWLIALDDFSYLVVLAVRKGYFLLRTAYPVTRTHTLIALVEECRNSDRCP